MHILLKSGQNLSEFTALQDPCEQINTFPYTHIYFLLNHSSLQICETALLHVMT
jgi:hypothetical protein